MKNVFSIDIGKRDTVETICYNDILNGTACKENDILLIDIPNTYCEKEYLNIITTIKNKYYNNIPRVALSFKQCDNMKEFSNWYISNESNRLPNTQIALCLKCEYKGEELPIVCWCLYNDDSDFIRDSYNKYRYYNLLVDDVTNYPKLPSELPLSTRKENPAESPPLFPFDLYLKTKQNSNGQKNVTWFENYVDKILNNCLTDDSIGCKVENINISMGTKIHMDTFYCADVLFNNIGFIDRFAYITAKKIFDESNIGANLNKNKPNKILLISYSDYSEIFLGRVKEIIKYMVSNGVDEPSAETEVENKIQTIVFKSDIDEIETTKTNGLWEDFYRFARDRNLSEYTAYIILPISTTLSTIWKIQGIAERLCDRIRSNYVGNDTAEETQHKLKFGSSVVLIVVEKEEENKVSMQYRCLNGKSIKIYQSLWEKPSNNEKTEKIVTAEGINSDKSNNRKEINADCFFLTKAKWTETISDDENAEKCLIGVDKKRNAPGTIMMRKNKNSKTKNKDEEEKRKNKIKDLYGCIRYSHLIENNNHYQYSIDFKKFFINAEEKGKKITGWLNEVPKEKLIDNDAMNIVLAPMTSNNTEFLNLVLATIFNNDVFLLRIDIQNSLKDDFIAKYYYLKEQVKRYKKKKLNVYFVDACIVSGANLERGKRLICQLFEKNNITYKGIILLINRCTEHTLDSFVHKKDNIFSFLELNVPSYNIINGKCPGCELLDVYKVLQKQTATPIIAKEYLYLIDKHTGRGNFDYDKWIQTQIKTKESFFCRLCQWLFCHSANFDKTQYIDIFFEQQDYKTKNFEIINVSDLVGRICGLRQKDDLKIKKIYDNEYNTKTIVSFVENVIQGEYNYLRIKCSDKAYKKLKNNINFKDEVWSDRVIDDTMTEIYKIINEDMQAVEDNVSKIGNIDSKELNLFKNWYKAELLLSFIKVISRKQLSKYYHIRAAINKILTEFIKCLISAESANKICETRNDDKKTFFNNIIELMSIEDDATVLNSFIPDLKVTILFAVLSRLSGLHSDLAIRNLEKIFDYYIECQRQAEESNKFFITNDTKNKYNALLPKLTDRYFAEHIVKMIKWSSMSDYDESKCFFIKKQTEKLLKAEEKNEKTKQIAGLIYLENAQVIYNGVKRLVEGIPEKIKKAPVDQLDNCKEDISAAIYKHINQFPGINLKQGEMTFTGTNGYFFSFVKQSGQNNDETTINNEQTKIYADMCSLYIAVKKMEEYTSEIESPYEYEQICNYIRDIAGYHQCKLLSGESDMINFLASSSYHSNPDGIIPIAKKFDYVEYDIPKELLYDCVNKFNVNRKKEETIGAECVIQTFDAYDSNKGYNYNVMLLHIPMYYGEKTNMYIALYSQYYRTESESGSESAVKLEKITIDILEKARNILFVRDKLTNILSRDVAALIDFSNTSKYIKRICSTDLNGKQNTENNRIKILHMSDLHISEDKLNTYKDSIKNNGFDNEPDGQPDLLLISGDIVMGNYNANALYNNYEAAVTVIKKIAATIWRTRKVDIIQERHFVRADWKKRIVISTGNHDYASMNELDAKNVRRNTTAGTTGNTSGNTMIKFSYFIDFLHKLLNTDIDNAVKYDLNNVLNYKNLDLTVININTNSALNPYRTNKVKINDSALNTVYERYKDGLCSNVIILMHHTPLYTIDYLADIYYLDFELNGTDIGEIYNRFNEFGITEKIFNEKWLELLESIANGKYGNEREKNNRLLKQYLQFIKEKSMQKYAESNLYPFEHYCSVSENDYACDDRCGLIAAELKNQKDVSDADMDVYINSFENILKKVDSNNKVKKFLILGGHVHAANRGNVRQTGLYTKNVGIYEVPKFFAKGKICCAEFFIEQNDSGLCIPNRIGIDNWNEKNFNYYR